MKLSQSMVELHSVLYTYNVETMLASRFIFNNCNTHNGLIFDPKGFSHTQKTAMSVWSRSWPITSTIFVKTLSYLTQFPIYIIRRYYYAVETVFNMLSMSNRPIYDPQPDKNSPQKCHVRSRCWRITSTVFVQTLSYITQLRV